MSIVNTAETLVAQCQAVMVAAMPRLNPRPMSPLEEGGSAREVA